MATSPSDTSQGNLPEDLGSDGAQLGHLGPWPHFKALIRPVKSPLPGKVTYSQVLGIRTRTSLGSCYRAGDKEEQ